MSAQFSLADRPQTTHPNSLKRKIVAAVISEAQGLRSVDYVLKTYLSDVKYSEQDRSRLDLRIHSFVSRKMNDLNCLTGLVRELPNKPTCKFVSEWTLARAPFSMELLAHCGNRGALFEALAIARMMFEQLAWAYVINTEIDQNAFQKLSAPRAIALFKIKFRFAGKLYGWLSSHVHWAFEGHKKCVVSHEEGIGHCLASSYFKALVFSIMILFSKLYIDVICALYTEELRLTHTVKPCDSVALKRECVALLNEVRQFDDRDPDLNLLSSMLAE